MDATRPLFWALLPTAPLGFLLMRQPWLYQRLWPIAQYAIGASEAAVRIDIRQRHRYQLDWLPERVVFSVDDHVVHTSPYSPAARLGLVIWIDNQFAIATPQGRFGWGLVEAAEAQWMDLFAVSVTSLRPTHSH
ncbi:MAG: hypothetical protein HC915_03225 [Anaerolineae bacterium]|nr:hypothetical protein [Anaerolineae bacterium]